MSELLTEEMPIADFLKKIIGMRDSRASELQKCAQDCHYAHWNHECAVIGSFDFIIESMADELLGVKVKSLGVTEKFPEILS